MTTTSLDAIVNDILLKKRYSLHWYLEFLLYCKEAVEELGYDGDIDTFRYAVLPLNNNHAIELPSDYVDWIRVSAFIGGRIYPLVEDNSINLVPNYDQNFDIQPYSGGVAVGGQSIGTPIYYNIGVTPYWFLTNYNMFGENLGRIYGGVIPNNTFRVNKLRNEIKINEAFNPPNNLILLEYCGNGLTADNATQIDVRAVATIKAYAIWKHKQNNRTYNLGEIAASEQEYIMERKKLRARKSDITIDKLRTIIRNNSVAVKT